MPMDENALRYLEEHIHELADSALKQAYWQALASGDSVLEVIDRTIYEVFPDGIKKPVKQLEPATPIPLGKKVELP